MAQTFTRGPGDGAGLRRDDRGDGYGSRDFSDQQGHGSQDRGGLSGYAYDAGRRARPRRRGRR
jgi:hypothetical protein